ncbi:hypothetical protein COV16_02480 [Candidatus Woesearchaeota archaeon CG10_big_fil_rev_8_21_14_0_10_34_8]|nr:MAG: hypothetical protein COV16_02480 [Candidatus Woesearchaeota archaeon CG10_big_fil_rev_8_21_14_0_10_34_8]
MKETTKVKLKLIVAIFIVIISLALGVYTKFMFLINLPDHFDWFDLILYIMSWVMLFVAAFFVGKEALILADQYIKRKMRETYDVTVDIHRKGIKKGIQTTKNIHKKTVEQSKKHLKKGVKIIKNVHKKLNN